MLWFTEGHDTADLKEAKALLRGNHPLRTAVLWVSEG
jgi:hypothetical protein